MAKCDKQREKSWKRPVRTVMRLSAFGFEPGLVRASCLSIIRKPYCGLVMVKYERDQQGCRRPLEFVLAHALTSLPKWIPVQKM